MDVLSNFRLKILVQQIFFFNLILVVKINFPKDKAQKVIKNVPK